MIDVYYLLKNHCKILIMTIEQSNPSQELSPEDQLDTFFEKRREPKRNQYRNLHSIETLAKGVLAMGGEVTVSFNQLIIKNNNKSVTYDIPINPTNTTGRLQTLHPISQDGTESVHPWRELLGLDQRERAIFTANPLNAFCQLQAHLIEERYKDMWNLSLLDPNRISYSHEVDDQLVFFDRTGLAASVPKYLAELISNDAIRNFALFEMVGRKAGELISDNSWFSTEVVTDPIHKARLEFFTFMGDPDAVQHEFVTTFFQMNSKIFMAAVTKGIEEKLISPQVFDSAEGMLSHIHQSWYTKILREAPVAANGFWVPNLRNPQLPDFFIRSGNEIVFSEEFLKDLHSQMQTRNAKVYQHNSTIKPMHGVTMESRTTSGCPVAHDTCSFSYDTHDVRYLTPELVTRLTQGNKPIAELEVESRRLKFNRHVITDIFLPIHTKTLVASAIRED